MFHMSNDSALFRTRAQLLGAGATEQGANWALPDGTIYVPLYEAKMVHQFDHRWAEYEEDGKATRDLDADDHTNPHRIARPRYWVPPTNRPLFSEHNLPQTFFCHIITQENDMEPSDAIDAESFWQGQVADWQASGLTQKAYCEEQGLRYTAFGYWVRKLRREAEPSPGKKPTCFVPVVPATATGLSLALPNGLEIRGIDSGNLPLVRQLLEVL